MYCYIFAHFSLFCFFFFNDTATTEIYTLSLHDALPIFGVSAPSRRVSMAWLLSAKTFPSRNDFASGSSNASLVFSSERSEEHTSELQSQSNLVCRLLLEKKKNSTHHLTRMYCA